MSKPKLFYAVALPCLAAGVVFALLTVHRAPSEAPALGASSFQSDRAMADVRQLSRKPRPLGTPAHAEARKWLVSELRTAGYEPEVQETLVSARFAGQRVGARVANVVAKLPGTRKGEGSLLLVAHYDSVAQSPGASDDGSGVAMLLETARALHTLPRPTNDILFLFSDGEELGLLGAHAFVAEHPAAKGVALALNFEARGSRGPVVMYDPSPASLALLSGFASAAARPYGGSFIARLAQFLPNDTDASVFKKAGMAVLAFAFADGIEHYHARTDGVSALDVASLAHGGRMALSLARHFGNADLKALGGTEAVYFDLFGRVLVLYPFAAARGLAVATLLLLIILSVVGLRRKRWTLSALASGLLLPLVSVLASVLFAFLLHALMVRLCGALPLAHLGAPFALCLVLLTVAIVLGAGRAMKTRGGAGATALGAAWFWMGLLMLSAAFAPAMSAFLQWPLLLTVAFGAPWFLSVDDPSPAARLSLFAGLFFALVYATLDLHTIFVATGVGFPAVAAGALALVLSLLAPLWLPLPSLFLRHGPRFGVASALVLSAALGVWTRLSPTVPRADHLAYGLESRWGLASYFTRDAKPDAWVRSALGPEAVHAELPFHRGGGTALMRPAPAAPLAPPEIAVLSDRIVEGKRHLSLALHPGRGARGVRLWDAGGARIWSERLGGKSPRELIRISMEADEKLYRMVLGERGAPVWHMDLWGFGETAMTLDLVVEPVAPLQLHAVSERDGFPAGVSIPPRPASRIPFQDSDVTLVSKRFVL
ncbi:MAG: M28 family peptidase [Spirochaetes bacterium]|nr:M28 family peptidase [Spirochaetota bacterium]